MPGPCRCSPIPSSSSWPGAREAKRSHTSSDDKTGHKTSAISPAAEPVEAPRRSASESRLDDKESGGSRSKTSSAAPPEPARTPLPPSEAAQPEPPKPDVWSDAQIITALRECVRLLAPIAADVEVSEPVKREQCGAPAPVLLKRIGSGANKVEISPPAVLNCAMVVSLHAWVEKTLQPAAQEALGSPVARLRNASGYVCRNRVGSSFHSDRLSEHALANAIDIAGFVTASGRTVDVAHAWGPTARDERDAQRTAAAQSKSGTAPADKGGASVRERPVNRKVSAIALASVEQPKGKKGTTPVQTAELQKGAKTSDVSTDPQAIPAPRAGGANEDPRKSAEGQFLRRLHMGACGVFGTVLGPEANEAHRDHFHFDLAQRRHSALCQ